MSITVVYQIRCHFSIFSLRFLVDLLRLMRHRSRNFIGTPDASDALPVSPRVHCDNLPGCTHRFDSELHISQDNLRAGGSVFANSILSSPSAADYF